MRAKASGLIGVVVHQHATSKVPADAGAHWLLPPQSGQTVFGNGVNGWDSEDMPQLCLSSRNNGCLGGA
jgi:hypothetical protein